MSVEIKINNEVKTATHEEVQVLAGLGVPFEYVGQGFEVYVLGRVKLPNRWSFNSVAEQQAAIDAIIAEGPLLRVVKLVNVRRVKLKYGQNWLLRFDYADKERDENLNLLLGRKYATEEEALEVVEEHEKLKVLREEQEAEQQKLRQALTNLQREHRDAEQKLREGFVKSVDYNLIPHFKSDRPDSNWGVRYDKWRRETGGKETLTAVGADD